MAEADHDDTSSQCELVSPREYVKRIAGDPAAETEAEYFIAERFRRGDLRYRYRGGDGELHHDDLPDDFRREAVIDFVTATATRPGRIVPKANPDFPFVASKPQWVGTLFSDWILSRGPSTSTKSFRPRRSQNLNSWPPARRRLSTPEVTPADKPAPRKRYRPKSAPAIAVLKHLLPTPRSTVPRGRPGFGAQSRVPRRVRQARESTRRTASAPPSCCAASAVKSSPDRAFQPTTPWPCWPMHLPANDAHGEHDSCCCARTPCANVVKPFSSLCRLFGSNRVIASSPRKKLRACAGSPAKRCGA